MDARQPNPLGETLRNKALVRTWQGSPILASPQQHKSVRRKSIEENIMRTIITMSVIAATVSSVAFAGNEVMIHTSTDVAKVLSVAPIAGPDTTRQSCHPTTVSKPAEHSVVGAVAGGLGGALIGSRFGGGRGKDALTVVGAIGGAMAGDRVGASMSGNEKEKGETCETIREPGKPTGYKVTFDYQGQQQTVTMDHDPGNSVRVHTDVTAE